MTNEARFALLGEKLSHTYSPLIHGALFEAAGIGASYIPFPCDRDALAATVTRMREEFSGFNVTIPYKEAVLPLLDEAEDRVRAIGSANTVLVEGGRLLGFSTDGQGFARAIQNFIPTPQSALILGAGGTARAVAWELQALGCWVFVLSRRTEQAAALAEALRKKGGVLRVGDRLSRYDLLVNTTPVGMFPNAGASPADASLLERCDAVFDAVYNPRETVLMRSAKKLGIPAMNGLPMLFCQAVEAQRLWGYTYDDAALRQAYIKLEGGAS